MRKRSHRQSFLGAQSDRILRELHVAIVGLGGGGSHVVQQLAHLGVGRLTLIDPDRIDETNLNRLVGGTTTDVRREVRKVAIGSRQVLRVLPDAVVIQVPKPWQLVPERLWDCHIVVGCLDTYDGRLQLEALARRYLIPYIDMGMDVAEENGRYSIFGQVMLSMPGMPCLRCTNVVTEECRAKEAGEYGAAGGRPQVVWPNGVLASLAVGLVVQLVTPWQSRPEPSVLLEFDGNRGTVERSTMLGSLCGCPHFELADNLGDPWFMLQRHPSRGSRSA
jgi:molybdopterin-synthase adenylyltransferase